jgi:homoprotocatechuate degradation regulator HpaR
MAKSRLVRSGGSKTATHRGVAAAARMPAFSRSLPMLMLWAREAMMQRFRPGLHARGLTDQQWRILRVLVDAQSCEIYELSARCCMHPASLSRLLPKLAAQGIVSRSTNAKDQRRVIVSLTPQGRKLFENCIAGANQIYAQLARDIGAGRTEHATQVLEDLIASLNAKGPNGHPREFEADAGLDARE